MRSASTVLYVLKKGGGLHRGGLLITIPSLESFLPLLPTALASRAISVFGLYKFDLDHFDPKELRIPLVNLSNLKRIQD